MFKTIAAIAAGIGIVLCFLAYLATREERFLHYVGFNCLVIILWAHEREAERLSARIDDLEDAHSRRWEP